MAGYVFISYSRKNQGYVAPLHDHLASHGVTCWYDYAMERGTSFPQIIAQKIEECSAVVLVMTPDAAASMWVNNEVQYAQLHDKPVVPLLLEGKVMISVAALDYEDVRGARMPSARLIDRLRDLVGPVAPLARTPSQASAAPEPAAVPVTAAVPAAGAPLAGVPAAGVPAGEVRGVPRPAPEPSLPLADRLHQYAELVHKVVFKAPPVGQRGYDEDTVDAFLDEVESWMASPGVGPGYLTVASVHNITFKKPPVGRRGYDEGEVDGFLDWVETVMAEVLQEIGTG